jgi:hypothetical protein
MSTTTVERPERTDTQTAHHRRRCRWRPAGSGADRHQVAIGKPDPGPEAVWVVTRIQWVPDRKDGQDRAPPDL